MVLLECKMEKQNSQGEHGQPIEQTRSLFCTCNSGVAHCQSQHQCHIWRMNSMFEANCTGKWAWQLSYQILCSSWGYERLQNSKDSFKTGFENVNIYLWELKIQISWLYWSHSVPLVLIFLRKQVPALYVSDCKQLIYYWELKVTKSSLISAIVNKRHMRLFPMRIFIASGNG